MAENHFDIDRSTHIRTSSANKDFYNLIVDEKKIFGDRRKFCVIDEPRQYENHRLSQE